MNRKDFYKEIMSQYTFDEDKIRRNAKRASSNNFLALSSRWLPLTTAAAVFVAVFGGYMLLNLGSDGGGERTMPLAVRVSHEERVDDITAFEELLRDDSSALKGNIYISFSKPLTYKEFDSVLDLVASDTGYIEIVALWNGEFVGADTALDRELIYSSNVFYSGAKIIATSP